MKRLALKTAWQGLSARERRLLCLGSAVALLALFWMTAIAPALDAVAHWQTELPALRRQQAEVRAVLAGLPPDPGQSGADAQFAAWTVQPQMERQRDGRWLIRFAGLEAAQFAAWLFERSAGLQQLSVTQGADGLEGSMVLSTSEKDLQ